MTVEAAVTAWVQARLVDLGRPGTPGAALDLGAAGVLDSVTLVDLLAAVQRATGREVDLLEVDLDALDTFAGLVAELTRVAG